MNPWGGPGCAGARSAPLVRDQVRRGLVSGLGDARFSSQGAAGSGVAPEGAFRADVAARPVRRSAAGVAPAPVAIVQAAIVVGTGPLNRGFERRGGAGRVPQVIAIDLLAMTTGGQCGSFSSGCLKGWGPWGIGLTLPSSLGPVPRDCGTDPVCGARV